MRINRFLVVTATAALLLGSAGITPASAQTATTPTVTAAPTTVPDPGNGNAGQPYNAAGEEQRDVNQQDRIESGLKDGDLTTKEAGQLEHGEQHIDATEAKDMSNGSLSPAERAQLANMQNRESARIKADDTNAAHGNPNSASDQRMQTDVQRDANQETRIDNGIKNGSVTDREASHLEAGQARNDHSQYRAARNGHISAAGQGRLQRQENRTSGGISDRRHNGRFRRNAQ